MSLAEKREIPTHAIELIKQHAILAKTHPNRLSQLFDIIEIADSLELQVTMDSFLNPRRLTFVYNNQHIEEYEIPEKED